MKAWQEIQVQALQASDSEHQLFQTIVSLATELGFDYCAYGLRLALPLSNPKIMKISNYPTAWQAQYQAKNYCAVDTTVKRALCSTLPILWTDGLFAATSEFWEEARSFGLRYCWAQSMRDVHGATGMLTLARSDEPISETELAAKAFKMAWLSQNAHIALSRSLLPNWLRFFTCRGLNRIKSDYFSKLLQSAIKYDWKKALVLLAEAGQLLHSACINLDVIEGLGSSSAKTIKAN
jgi:LuxR family quorum-sensing system transcriptional regulator SolR